MVKSHLVECAGTSACGTRAQAADCSALLGAQAAATSEATVCVAKIPKTIHTDLPALLPAPEHPSTL